MSSLCHMVTSFEDCIMAYIIIPLMSAASLTVVMAIEL